MEGKKSSLDVVAAVVGRGNEMGNAAMKTLEMEMEHDAENGSGSDNVQLPPVPPTPTPLQQLVDACRLAFTGSSGSPTDHAVSSIRGLMDKIGMLDVGLMDEVGFFYVRSTVRRQITPMFTWKIIYQCDNFKVAVFYLPKGVGIPLHENPSVKVISKLLVGSAHIEAYDWVFPHIIAAGSRSAMLTKKVTDQHVTAPSGASVKIQDYIHSFKAGQDGPCAFLNVFVPLHSPAEKSCSAFYKDFPYEFQPKVASGEAPEEQKSRLAWLHKIDEPKDVKALLLPCRGPPIV